MARTELQMALEMHDVQYERANRLEAERDQLRAYMQQIADHGLSSDLAPTMMFGGSEGAMYIQLCDYLKRIDASFRRFAADVLDEVSA